MNVRTFEEQVAYVLRQPWNPREARVVPTTESIALTGGSAKIDAAVLYVDLSESSRLATEFQQRTAAKVIRAFLSCMCRLIRLHQGTVTSFDGDRVMGIFIGDSKENHSTICSLKMNFVVERIIKPMATEYFTSLQKRSRSIPLLRPALLTASVPDQVESLFDISHCVGIDASSILAVKAGIRNANDLVWIGRAPNLAAKLSGIRHDRFRTVISPEIYSSLKGEAKYDSVDGQIIWESCKYTFVGEEMTVYCSGSSLAPLRPPLVRRR